MTYFHVLDDDLLTLWQQFKQGINVEIRPLEKLLRFYQPPHLTCAAQMQRCGIDNPPLMQALAAQGFTNQTLAKLAEQTQFKYILSSENNIYPFVHLDAKNTSTELTYRFLIGKSRQALHEHLKNLLTNAKVIVVADKYLDENFSNTKQVFNLLPSVACTVCLTYEISKQNQSEIKKMKPNLKLINDTRSDYSQRHDRYLLIDNTIEVTLTSGVDYLFDTRKECTAIIRYHKGQP